MLQRAMARRTIVTCPLARQSMMGAAEQPAGCQFPTDCPSPAAMIGPTTHSRRET